MGTQLWADQVLVVADGGLAVVGTIRGHGGDTALYLPEWIWRLSCVVAVAIGRHVGSDLAAAGAHGKVEFAPLPAGAAVFLYVPLALPERLQDTRPHPYTNAGGTITRKLILVIAWFNIFGLFLNGCRVPMEATNKIGSKTSPLGWVCLGSQSCFMKGQPLLIQHAHYLLA